MTTMVPITCDKCGHTTETELHTLPDGWVQSHGDNFCEVCMSPITWALEALQKKETNQ